MSYCTYWLGQDTGCLQFHWLPGHLSATSHWLPGGEWEESSTHPPPVAERVNLSRLTELTDLNTQLPVRQKEVYPPDIQSPQSAGRVPATCHMTWKKKPTRLLGSIFAWAGYQPEEKSKG
ncbi:hypothetical protein LDENG_00287250 [Lucifuga dentata]|nr:hypothetical protein LDENG_00287250 [Lucifuga dentata]